MIKQDLADSNTSIILLVARPKRAFSNRMELLKKFSPCKISHYTVILPHPFDDDLSSLNQIQRREEGNLVETNRLKITVSLVKFTDFFRYLQ